LVAVHKDHARHVEREQHVQEQDLVRPDHALLVGLLVQPVGPLVRYKLVVEAVLQIKKIVKKSKYVESAVQQASLKK
jgi:hypothetical protein